MNVDRIHTSLVALSARTVNNVYCFYCILFAFYNKKLRNEHIKFINYYDAPMSFRHLQCVLSYNQLNLISLRTGFKDFSEFCILLIFFCLLQH